MARGRRIIILGAGYGGLHAALTLTRLVREGPAAEIVLADRNPYHTHVSRLHELAVRDAPVRFELRDILVGLPIVFREGVVTSVDPGKRIVRFGKETLPYDHAVIALGSRTDFRGLPGMVRGAFGLKSLEETLRLREHIERSLVEAVSAKGVEREKLLTFAVVGSGQSGSELAGELAHRMNEGRLPVGLSRKDVRVVLVERTGRILPAMEEVHSRYAAEVLKSVGVEILTGRPVASYKNNLLKLEGGESIRAKTVVWTAGVTAALPKLPKGLECGSLGRLAVNDCLEVEGAEGLYAVGDAALVPGPGERFLSPSAQFATQAGDAVARVIAAKLEGAPPSPFRPLNMGEFVSLGPEKATGWAGAGPFGKVVMQGLRGSMLKRVAAEKHFYQIKTASGNLFGPADNEP